MPIKQAFCLSVFIQMTIIATAEFTNRQNICIDKRHIARYNGSK